VGDRALVVMNDNMGVQIFMNVLVRTRSVAKIEDWYQR